VVKSLLVTGVSQQLARDLPSRARRDGSTTIWFGPEPPAGNESNWVPTVPGKGWFTILRLYGPLDPRFDKSWRPSEIAIVN